MRAISTIALLLLCSIWVAAQEDAKTPLPRDAQTAMDAFAKTQAKLDEDYKKKMNAERQKLYDALDKSSQAAAKKGDADAIVALKAEMKKLVAEANKDDSSSTLGQSPKGKFVVLKVEYGTGKTWTDITKWSQKQADKDGVIEFEEGNILQEFADPASGVHKSIKVTYSDGGPEKVKNFTGKVHLPIVEDDTKAK